MFALRRRSEYHATCPQRIGALDGHCVGGFLGVRPTFLRIVVIDLQPHRLQPIQPVYCCGEDTVELFIDGLCHALQRHAYCIHKQKCEHKHKNNPIKHMVIRNECVP